MWARVPSCKLGLSLFLATTCFAFGAAEIADTGFVSRVWQTEDGLPQNTVTSIVQTRDGYLWIGTLGGLARFDGQRFQDFERTNTPGLKDGRISSLFEDSGGKLWIGHDLSGVTLYKDGLFTPYKGRATKPDKAADIFGDAAGGIWLLHPDSTIESTESGEMFTPPGRATPPDSLKLIRTLGGDIWVVSDGSLSHFVGKHFEAAQLGGAQLESYVIAIGSATDGGTWVVADGKIRELHKGIWSQDLGDAPWETRMVTGIIEMHDGTIAVGTDIGLFMRSPKGSWAHIDHSNGLSDDWVRAMYEDREGDLWIAAGSAGLVELRRTPFNVLRPPDRWHGHTPISAMATPDGALWVGTEGAGIYRYLRGSWSRFAEGQGVGNPYVWALENGPMGEIWAGSYSGGPYALVGDGFVRINGGPGITPPIISLMAQGEAGSFYAGTAQGLALYHDSKFELLYRTSSPSRNVCTIAKGRNGTIWFGISPGGLGKIENGHVTVYQKSDGLSSDAVQCLLPDGDDLWIGTTDGGLNLMHGGHLSAIGTEQGLPSSTICYIADDLQGFLILSTHHGIVRVSKKELRQCAEGRVTRIAAQVFDREDGLPTIEFVGGMRAAGCRAPDGRLWFPSNKGLVGVNPAEINVNSFIPPLVIESVVVDGHPVFSGSVSKTAVHLSPNHERMEILYTALTFVASSKAHFKYRMVGVDNDWVDAGEKRSASYSHLAAGHYSFQVIASNNDGYWNTKGASFDFDVLPFFWQTWWFLTLIAVGAFLIVALLARHETRRRMQLRLDRLEREGALERERTRIAQDIHDDIGASLTRIAMISQSERPGGEDSPRESERLSRIYSAASEMTRSLDEIVWAIDPRYDTLNSLAYYMGRFAQEMLDLACVRCRLDLPTDLPIRHLTTQTRHNLLLAFKEALNNAIKHSGATEVRIALAMTERGISIVIEDNGRGIAPSGGTESQALQGEGLTNMQRRLNQIGGTCKIGHSSSGGASICFTVVLPNLK